MCLYIYFLTIQTDSYSVGAVKFGDILWEEDGIRVGIIGISLVRNGGLPVVVSGVRKAFILDVDVIGFCSVSFEGGEDGCTVEFEVDDVVVEGSLGGQMH